MWAKSRHAIDVETGQDETVDLLGSKVFKLMLDNRSTPDDNYKKVYACRYKHSK